MSMYHSIQDIPLRIPPNSKNWLHIYLRPGIISRVIGCKWCRSALEVFHGSNYVILRSRELDSLLGLAVVVLRLDVNWNRIDD